MDAAAAGATWVGGRSGSVADISDELARSLTAPLRDRIDRSFSAADGNLDDVADRVRALYREWKGQRLTDTSRHYAAAAYARGVFDATPSGTEVHWVKRIHEFHSLETPAPAIRASTPDSDARTSPTRPRTSSW